MCSSWRYLGSRTWLCRLGYYRYGKVSGVLEKIFVFFTGRTKRHEELNEKSREVENFLQLRNLSTTRWTARPVSVEAVCRGLDAKIVDLEEIRRTSDKDGKSKAANLINATVNIDFVCRKMVLENIMYKTKLLADFLPKKNC